MAFALISLVSVFLLCLFLLLLLLFSWLSCWAAIPGIDELCMQEVSGSFLLHLFVLCPPQPCSASS